jgi:dipeptidyl aminopeptidase/acylaminoacyl peptidase
MNAHQVVRLVLTVGAVLSYAGLATVAATPIRQLTAAQQASLRPALSPDGQRVAFQRNEGDGRYRIWVMDADGGGAKRLTTGDADDRHPAWSPDGRTLAVDSGSDNRREIWLIDVASAQRTQVTKLGGVASFPTFRPDGARIAFFAYREGGTDLWTIGRDGANAQRITTDLASEQRQQCTFACHGAAWSPRGDRIAISSGDQSRVLVLAPTPGSVPLSISPEDEKAHFPTYLADGRLVYVSEHITLDQSWTDLWAQPADEGSARTALVMGVQAQGPFEISRDAGQLLFASPRTGTFEIYAVTLDDAGKAALAERVVRGGGGAQASLTPGAVASAQRKDAGPFGESTPYVIALVAIGLVGLGVELFVRARRAR